MICEMLVNYSENPNNVGENVLFSYQSESAASYYVLNVYSKAGNEKEEMWTVRLEAESLEFPVVYNGNKLKSNEKYYWNVSSYDEADNLLESGEAFFETALLDKCDWIAEYITSDGEWYDSFEKGDKFPSKCAPAPMFRKEFVIKGKVKSAKLFISALGYGITTLNGKEIGDNVISTPAGMYNKTVWYNTVDITRKVKNGANCIGITVGNGWYNEFIPGAWDFDVLPWRDRPKVICQIEIKYYDGSKDVIGTDDTWDAYTNGPVRFDALRNGVHYDARFEVPGWDMPGAKLRGWEKSVCAEKAKGALTSCEMEPVKVIEVFEPVNQWQAPDGAWILDFGINMSGVGMVNMCGKSGKMLTLKYGELLDDKNDLDISNINQFCLAGEFQTDKYIFRGNDTETWYPRFTYHGFQYIKAEGPKRAPELGGIKACMIYNDIKHAGEFTTDNELLNKIQEAICHSTMTNYHWIPTDCPQREKNGWTGDASLSSDQFLMNYNPVKAYYKWMKDLSDAQQEDGKLPAVIPGDWNYEAGPAWDGAYFIIPYNVYLYTGDKLLLTSLYPNLCRYFAWLSTKAVNNIVDFGLGDWCPPYGQPESYECPRSVTATAYYSIFARILSLAAELLGKEEESHYYKKIENEIRDSFREEFVDFDKGTVKGDCQTSVACAIYQGMLNKNEIGKFAVRLKELIEEKDGHIDCGILGTKYIFGALTECGMSELAYEMAVKEDYPSWGYWFKKGATTLWERWQGSDSHNHHMFSSIGEWFYRGIAGINPTLSEPGFKYIDFRPNLMDRICKVKATHECVYGLISVSWTTKGGFTELKIKVPNKCRADVQLPSGYIFEDGNKYLKLEEGEHTLVCIKG